MTETNENNYKNENMQRAGQKNEEEFPVPPSFLPCESTTDNTIVTSGFGDFFLKKWDYEYLTQMYWGVYSINGARVNRAKAIYIYRNFGIFKGQFINPSRERVNLSVLRECNPGYDGLSNFQLIEKFFREGICLNCKIDNIPTKKCSEGEDSFPIPDFNFFDSLDEVDLDQYQPLLSAEAAMVNDYDVMTDLVNWPYVAFTNPEIQKNGYVGFTDIIEWFFSIGIYKNININPYGSKINLNYVYLANRLFRLTTYRQVVSWILQFGRTDPDAIIVTPEVQTSGSLNLRPSSWRKNSKMSLFINEFVKNNLLNQNYVPPTELSENFVFSPDGSINVNPSNLPNINTEGGFVPTARIANPNQTTPQNFSGANTINRTNSMNQNMVNRNFRSGNLGPNSSRYAAFALNKSFDNNNATARDSFDNENIAVPSTSFNPYAFSTRNVEQQQDIILSENNPSNTPSNPIACTNCKPSTDSFATAQASPSVSVPPTCENCVTQISAFGPVGNRKGFISPLSITTNPLTSRLNGNLGQSILLDPSIPLRDEINATNGIFRPNGRASVPPRNPTYYDNTNSSAFFKRFNLPFFN